MLKFSNPSSEVRKSFAGRNSVHVIYVAYFYSSRSIGNKIQVKFQVYNGIAVSFV